MGTNDFASLLNKQIKKATSKAEPEGKAETVKNPVAKAAAAPVAKPQPVAKAPETEEAEQSAEAPPKAAKKTGKGISRQNSNRITVNLFEADIRALAVIKELLGTEGFDFANRSDSMKVGLRLAAKAKPEELAKILDQVRLEDKRFSRGG